MDTSNNYGQRKMYQGKWKCAECGGEITELPFEPDGVRDVYCPSCHRAKNNNGSQRRF